MAEWHSLGRMIHLETPVDPSGSDCLGEPNPLDIPIKPLCRNVLVKLTHLETLAES